MVNSKVEQKGMVIEENKEKKEKEIERLLGTWQNQKVL